MTSEFVAELPDEQALLWLLSSLADDPVFAGRMTFPMRVHVMIKDDMVTIRRKDNV